MLGCCERLYRRTSISPFFENAWRCGLKKWEDFKGEEKRQIEMIQGTVENLLKTSEKTFLTDSNKWDKEGM